MQSKKGVNLPNTITSLPCLTKKDKKDLTFILNEKVEWIGLSFVRSANDIKTLKVQGATNVAKAGIRALKIQSDPTSIRSLNSFILILKFKLEIEVFIPLIAISLVNSKFLMSLSAKVVILF